MLKYEQYNHHGVDVWVDTYLKGNHRDHCLCWSCEKFNPEDREANCKIANMVYALCVLENLVLPVWECPEFQE